MQQKLQRRLVKKILNSLFIPLILAVVPVVCFGQSVLAPGDLLVAEISSYAPVNFQFVPLVDLEKGTAIHFTKNFYDSAKSSLTQGEGTLVYTAPETIPAGTVISYAGRDQAVFSGSAMETDSSGDVMLVYQVSDSDTTFIYGIGWGNDSEVWSDGDSRDDAGYHSGIPRGLSKADFTAVSLEAGQNHRYDTRKGTEGSPKTLLRLVGDSRNWISGKKASLDMMSDISFKVIHPPVLRFPSEKLTVSATADVIHLPVELAETNGEAVSAEVVFLSALSSVSGEFSRIFTSQTVRFSEGDAAGTRKTIRVDLPRNSLHNQSQTVVFGLKDNSSGSVAAPRTIEIVVEGNEIPPVMITEINATPGEDADGNGVVDESDDEFIEFVNTGQTNVDISGWTFSDNGRTVRHIFPPGTVIPPSGALVLFGNDKVKPSGSFGGAIVQNSNQSSTLHLDNRGDTPTLKDAKGNVMARYAYGSEADDRQSLTRSMDRGGSFRKHSDISGSDRLTSSPGTQADGSSYGFSPRLGIRELEGWRMLSVPTKNTSFNDLLESFRTQGVTGSDDPAAEATIYSWDEATGGTLAIPMNMADVLEAGKGYMVYFFEDDEAESADIQNGIPRTIIADKTGNDRSVSVGVSATDANNNGVIDQNEGFNLLGNPFETYISVTAVLDALEKIDDSLARNILIWNPSAGGGNGSYQLLTDGEFIAPFQAFFVRFMAEVKGNLVLNKTDLQERRGKALYEETKENNFGYRILLNDGLYSDAFDLVFGEEGKTGFDEMDGHKLFSLNPGSVNLFSTEGDLRLMKNMLPADLDVTIEIPLHLEVPEEKESLEFLWESSGQVPDDWDIILTDRELEKDIDLRSNTRYEFTRISEAGNNITAEDTEVLVKHTESEETEPRFVLVVSPTAGLNAVQDKISESVKLNPNYPNPFTSATTIPFELSAETEVTLSVWNIVGQKVATLIDGMKEAGPDQVTWNATDMPSGIYIAQLEVGGSVYIRKMTLIKN